MKNSKTLNKINLSVGDEVFVIQLGILLHINENTIEDEAESTLANYGYFATLKAKLSRVVSDTQLQVDSMYSELFLELKKEEEQGSRVSDRHAEAFARDDEDFQDLMESLNKAKEQYQVISGATKSLELKLNIIQTISANQRRS
jgi:hypothetical protein